MKGGSGPGTPFPIGPTGWSLIAEAASWLFGSGNSGGSGNDGSGSDMQWGSGNTILRNSGNGNNFYMGGQQLQIISADSVKVVKPDGTIIMKYGPDYGSGNSGGSN